MERRFSRPRFRDRGFESFEKPVKVGETYDVEIKETGSKGDGIARVKNFVVFVANAKKGDKCKIKITEVARRFAIGEKVEGAEVAEEPEGVKEEPEGVEEKVGEAEVAEKPKKKKPKKEKKPKEPEKLEGEKVEDK